MIHAKSILGYESVEMELDLAKGGDSSGARCSPRLRMPLEHGSVWHCDSDLFVLYLIVLRMRARLVPRGATCLKFSFRNILGVPNQSHSGTAAIFLDTTG